MTQDCRRRRSRARRRAAPSFGRCARGDGAQVGLADDAVGGGAVGFGGGTAVVDDAVVVVVGDIEGAFAVDGEGTRIADLRGGGAGGVGDEVGLAEHAIGGRSVGEGGGGIEAKHAVVGLVGDPEATGGVEEDADGPDMVRLVVLLVPVSKSGCPRTAVAGLHPRVWRRHQSGGRGGSRSRRTRGGRMRRRGHPKGHPS